MPLAAGTKLDGYEILGLLGAGGMGEVHRARDPALKREVAIKLLPTFVAQDPDRLRRFEQEAQTAAALNHPNILAVHRFSVFEGVPYLVSELLEGSTLRQVLQRGPLPVRAPAGTEIIAWQPFMNGALNSYVSSMSQCLCSQSTNSV
jgi:eukaryotic-like serine/threonine-protein kinase